MENKFLYPVSVQVNTIEDSDRIRKELESFGYNTTTFGSNRIPCIIATNVGSIPDKYTNFFSPDVNIANRNDRYYCFDNVELFLALAAMQDGGAFYPGEILIYYNRIRDTNAGVGSIAKVTHIRGDVSVDVEWLYIRPAEGYLAFQNEGTYYGGSFRRATKEEIIQHFSTNTLKQNIMSESKVIIGYNLFGVIKTLEEWKKVFGEGFRIVDNAEFEPVYEWKVKKGDYLYCHTDLVMDNGEIRANKGRVYISEYDKCFTDNSGDKNHGIYSSDNYKWFRPATTEEIKTSKTPIIIDGRHMEIAKDGTFGFGCRKEFTYQDAISYRKLLNKGLTIQSPNGYDIDIELLDKIINNLPK